MAPTSAVCIFSFILLSILSSAFSTEHIKVVFPGTSKKSYVKIMGSLPTMDEFTLCYWKKVNMYRAGKMYMFSYATTKQPDMLNTWTEKVGNDTEKYRIGANIGGDAVIMNVDAPLGKYYDFMF